MRTAGHCPAVFIAECAFRTRQAGGSWSSSGRSGWPEIAAQFGICDGRIVRPGRDNQRYQASSHKEDTHLTSPFSAAKAEPNSGPFAFSESNVSAPSICAVLVITKKRFLDLVRAAPACVLLVPDCLRPARLTALFLIKTDTNSLTGSTQTMGKDGLRPGYLFRLGGLAWISRSSTHTARIF